MKKCFNVTYGVKAKLVENGFAPRIAESKYKQVSGVSTATFILALTLGASYPANNVDRTIKLVDSTLDELGTATHEVKLLTKKDNNVEIQVTFTVK